MTHRVLTFAYPLQLHKIVVSQKKAVINYCSSTNKDSDVSKYLSLLEENARKNLANTATELYECGLSFHVCVRTRLFQTILVSYVTSTFAVLDLKHGTLISIF